MKITIQGHGKLVLQEYRQPVPLSTVFRDAGLPADFPCGGKGRCGNCRVWAKGHLSPPSPQELEHLSPQDLKEGIRLACMTTVLGDAWVRLPQDGQRILTDGSRAPFLPDREEGWGFAVDIGTTTVAAYLYPLGQKEPAAVASEKNPQCRFGADVISRIERSMAGDREALAAAIRQCLGRLLQTLCTRQGLSPRQIRKGVIVGNTAMLYLLCGEEVSSIAAAPFRSRLLWGEWLPASRLDLPVPPDTPCYLPRCISAYVGADITASILAAGYPAQRPTLLVDIGTNGEMALLRGEELLCCSTAAGPAFEGAGISRGMNASPGAICRVDCKGDDLSISVLGDLPPKGICGSGLIDAVAALLRLGAVDETGLLLEEGHPLLPRITQEQGRPAIRLAGDVLLTQQDIRAVQLAKSAICAGMLTLLGQAGLSPGDLGELVIAGGFGSSIRLENAQAIGLIPPGLLEKARFIGNGAGGGASMILLSEKERERALRLAGRAATVELSSNPVFTDLYMDNMFFPL